MQPTAPADDVAEEDVESELDVDVVDCWACRAAIRLCRNCCKAAAAGSVESELEVEDVELVDALADEDAVLASTDAAEDVDCIWYKDGSHCESKLFSEVTLMIAPGK